jgi:translation initiation factor 3 subunit G
MPSVTAPAPKVQWSDDVDEFPFTEVIGPNEDGIKTVIERYIDENDKKVQVTRQIKVQKVEEKVNHAVATRKHWKKFGDAAGLGVGPDSSTTKVDDEFILKLGVKSIVAPAQEEAAANPLAVLKTKDSRVVCRICKGDHWTLKCPYKDTIGVIADVLPADEGAPAEGKSAAPEEPAKKPTGKYVPPNRRDGATGVKREEGTPGRRSEENTIRVSNLSEDTRESDLSELFRPFGHVTRVFLVRDKNSGASKGFAFVSFSTREEGARAIKAVNGYGYDNLILKVEWSRPSSD